MVQAVEDRPGNHLLVDLATAPQWSLQSKRSVGAIMVVIAHELGQHRSDMPFAQRKDVIQALPATMVCRNAASVNSITRPRRTRAVTLPGGRGERFGHALGAERRWAQREPGSAGRGLGGGAPGDSGPGTP
jgi:hypothetical protein